ncbi:MAG: nickel pincer cofactor biosynthesis protein LarC [Akkermansia sp.]
MSNILYYDCFAGISGDMNLGALVDLGVPFEYLDKNLAKLHLSGYSLCAQKAQKSGIAGTQFIVTVDDDHHHHHHHHRKLQDICAIINESELRDTIKNKSIAIFQTLANAEAQVHDTTPDEIHFHEVGAIDSIIDIVGACICLDYLQVEHIICHSVELGSGVIHCQHGILPVPAPATAILAQQFPSSIGGTDHEATTPTGAAFLATLVNQWGGCIAGTCRGNGIGIGQRDSKKLPNILPVMMYSDSNSETNLDSSPNEHVLLCANIDDMTAEHLAYLTEQLLVSGACDAWMEPIMMKKNRPATKVCALVSHNHLANVKTAFFKHSSTLGLRTSNVTKLTLPREEKTISSPWGSIRLKFATLEDGTIRSKPEFDDCRLIAEREGIPLSVIMNSIKSHE